MSNQRARQQHYNQEDNDSGLDGEDMDVDVIGDEDDEMYHNSAGAIPQALIKDALRKIHVSYTL